ncbi:hypothetical protein ABFW14_11445 [Mycolicibacterium fortuitum]|uniref:hypothetical protein n=1 Tax=Mycolicibacterium TaxID=1866885 RepID=UPI0007EDC5DA|nr:hypothetical protein [Mycolicibacterium fortuitum]MCA4751144.1 hypothetical protein [Mycolicibacterium fortuitum]NOP96460.1 hypothetical protein [Mycolicibacterium fortuitum]OBK03656.1 hypothetical protein A5637_13705 [Mycolicibacterium fortuitum]UBV15759.1 hypothetical protein H8Z57_02380 [Mycolicibacterium fortuitum]
MTTPSNAHGRGWGQRPHSIDALDHRLSRWQARQMSRRFAGVGVGIPAARLREISSGAPAADAELAGVQFAFVADELMHDERIAKLARGKQRCASWFVVVVMGLIMFSSLLCMVVLLLSLMQHSAPF